LQAKQGPLRQKAPKYSLWAFVLWKADCNLWFAASILEESFQVRARFERFEPGWLQRAGKSDLYGLRDSEDPASQLSDQ
jgi:hypothetical protein